MSDLGHEMNHTPRHQALSVGRRPQNESLARGSSTYEHTRGVIHTQVSEKLGVHFFIHQCFQDVFFEVVSLVR